MCNRLVRRPGKHSLWFVAVWLLVPFTSAYAQDDEIEPNNSMAQANGISAPFTLVRAEIDTTSDVDFYRFSVTTGQKVTIWVQARSIDSGLTPRLSLHNDSGDLIGYNDTEINLSTPALTRDEPILYLKFPVGGNYFVSVSSLSGTGDYSLLLVPQFDGSFVGDANEPNDSQAAATPISLPHQSYGANLIHLGDLDWYAFQAEQGQSISIDVDALQNTANAAFPMILSARVGLFDEARSLIQSADIGPDPDDGFSDDPVLTFEVPRSATYFIAVTTNIDSDFVTAFNNTVFLQDPLVGSRENLIGYYKLQVRVLRRMHFAHIANGVYGDVRFATSLILLNFNNAEATGFIRLVKQNGTPMTSSASKACAPGRDCYFSIPAKGVLMVETNGLGPGESGYGTIVTTSPLGGSAVFSEYDAAGVLITEAGVSASTAVEFFVVPVDVTGDFNTALAIANALHDFPANLFIKLVDGSGATVDTRDVILQGGEQTSLFVSGPGQLFPNIQNFRGSLQVYSDVPVASIALRSSNRTLTTLAPSTINLSPEPTQLYFPHVVVGGDTNFYRSTIILTNPGFFPASGTIRFVRSDGTPMIVNFGSNALSVHSFSITPQGVLFLESLSTGSLESGYAIVESDRGLGGVIIFSQYDTVTGALLTEAAVPPSPKYDNFCIFVQSQGDYSTGIALANTSEDSTDIDLTLRSSSDPLPIELADPLEGGAHRAKLISGEGQLFPGFTGLGTLEISSSQGIPAATLRITAKTMTVLPVVPVP